MTVGVWARRFRSRWRKWWRDPAAFVDDLPPGAARSAAVFGLAGGTILSDVLDPSGRRAADAWRREQVALRCNGSADGDFHFQTGAGREPDAWPERVRLRAEEGTLVVVARDSSGAALAAAEVGPSSAGVISLGRRPATARIYRIDRAAPAPRALEVEPLGRVALVDWLQRRGHGLADALKAAWPPTERRPSEPRQAEYRAWIERNEPGDEELRRLRQLLASRTDLPRIAVLMPVHDPRPAHLKAAIGSVTGQLYGDWILCVADDGSRSAEVRRVLAEASAGDHRIRLIRSEAAEGVAAATNAALALADGEGLGLFLDHDDVLAAHALALIALAMADNPQAAAAYADEDVMDSDGRRSAPSFKPDLDRERLLAQNYVNHPFAVRLDLLRRLGGLSAGVDGAQDHDLVLRVTESGAGPVLHLPHVLYHWRVFPGGGSFSQAGKGQADAARLKAVAGHLDRTGRVARLRPGPRGHLRVGHALPQPAPTVTAIIPTRDRPGLLQACVAGLLQQTDYPGLDIRIVDNGSRTRAAQDMLARLGEDPRIEVLRIDGPFNFAHLNNAAAAEAKGRVLAFVNDDIMVVEPGWLKALAALAVQPGVGAVGAKLFYPDGRIQHAGIVLGLGPQGVAGHEFRGAPGDSPGPQNRLMVAREVSAVTAACMAIEASRFAAVGGFDETAFPVAFNDVDLCLRLRQQGLRNLWTPQARLMHLESATRGSDKAEAEGRRFAAEARRMHERWGALLQADPCYNPNLTLEDESFTLAERSRAASAG